MSSTQLVYWGDTFLYTLTASVVEIIITESDKVIVVLDATVFYPAGGVYFLSFIYFSLVR